MKELERIADNIIYTVLGKENPTKGEIQGLQASLNVFRKIDGLNLIPMTGIKDNSTIAAINNQIDMDPALAGELGPLDGMDLNTIDDILTRPSYPLSAHLQYLNHKFDLDMDNGFSHETAHKVIEHAQKNAEITGNLNSGLIRNILDTANPNDLQKFQNALNNSEAFKNRVEKLIQSTSGLSEPDVRVFELKTLLKAGGHFSGELDATRDQQLESAIERFENPSKMRNDFNNSIRPDTGLPQQNTPDTAPQPTIPPRLGA